MRRNQLYFLVAVLFASTWHAGRARAQVLSDLRPAKPIMMLLVDTSGSMEYRRDEGGHVDRLPICTGNTINDVNQKSRWAVTLEALTGSFQGFTCSSENRSSYPIGTYDRGYYIPHHKIGYTSQDRRSGILEAFGSRLKFGLMTFDGQLTTTEGATLVPFTSYSANSDFKAQVDGKLGMWSYPNTDEKGSGHGWMQLFYPGCMSPYGVNAGARSKEAEVGALVSVGRDESESGIAGVNNQIRESLLKVRPYGGTPIAGMLDDLRYYLKNDDDIRKDPYRQCRDRYAVLLTDGAPDDLYRNTAFKCEQQTVSADGMACAGIDCCPYDPERNLAEYLVQADGLKKLWVVAFNVNDAAGIAKLDQIAEKGNTGKAISVQTAGDLRRELSRLMSEANPTATSRSVPVVVSNGRVLQLGGRQYEISAGFRVGQFEDPWDGFLFRRRYSCDGTNPVLLPLDESEGDMFHLRLDARSGLDRNIFTVAPPIASDGSSPTASGSLFSAASNEIDGSTYSGAKINSVSPNGGQPLPSPPTLVVGPTAEPVSHASFNTSLDSRYFEDADGNDIPKQASDRDFINDYLRGISPNRANKKLGDIYHSNPVVLAPLAKGSDLLNTFDPQLRGFYDDVTRTEVLSKSPASTLALHATGRYGAAGRPGVVFVGTNDGILHAFSLENYRSLGTSTATYAAGQELWGFVPPALFSKLDEASAPSHVEMFDGTPVVRDVIYKRLATSNTKQMGTVLLAAVRGAPSYVALDVTYPDDPKFLWQRTFQNLGPTVATPAIAHARITWNNVEQVRALAILPGGAGTPGGTGSCPRNTTNHGTLSPSRDSVRCWGATGRSLYVVDVATGELVQEFDTRHFHSPLTGAVAVDSEGLALTRAAYMTDEDGFLWRLWMNDRNPANWRVQPIWDIFAGTAVRADDAGSTELAAASGAELYKAGRPAITPPLLTRDPATGNYNILVGTGDVDQLSESLPHRVVSLIEKRVLDSSGNLTSSSTVTLGWALQLEQKEAVTGPLTVFDQTLYFTTFRPSSGDDLCEIGTSRIWGAHVRERQGALPKPMLAKGGTFVLNDTPAEAPNSLLLGLSITKEPVCTALVSSTNDPFGAPLRGTGPTGGGGYVMRSMVAGGGTSDTLMQNSDTSGMSGLHQLQRTLAIPNVAQSVGWANSIE